MPDRKITELAPIDSVSAGDLILVIDDPGVVPVSRKATVSQLLSNIPESALALSDNTVGNATTARHGFLSRLPGGTTDILRGDGTFAPATLPSQSGQTLVGRGLEAAGAPHAVTVGAGLVFTGPTALDVADIYVKRGVAETAASPLTISSSYYPSLVLRDSDAAVDQKDWYLRHEDATGRFVVQAINDANTVLQSVPLELDRAGNVYLGPTVATNFRAIGAQRDAAGACRPRSGIVGLRRARVSPRLQQRHGRVSPDPDLWGPHGVEGVAGHVGRYLSRQPGQRGGADDLVSLGSLDVRPVHEYRALCHVVPVDGGRPFGGWRRHVRRSRHLRQPDGL